MAIDSLNRSNPSRSPNSKPCSIKLDSLPISGSCHPERPGSHAAIACPISSALSSWMK